MHVKFVAIKKCDDREGANVNLGSKFRFSFDHMTSTVDAFRVIINRLSVSIYSKI